MNKKIMLSGIVISLGLTVVACGTNEKEILQNSKLSYTKEIISNTEKVNKMQKKRDELTKEIKKEKDPHVLCEIQNEIYNTEKEIIEYNKIIAKKEMELSEVNKLLEEK